MNQAETPPPPLTPTKLVTIALLAIVLVIVLVVQFSGSSDPIVIKRRQPRGSPGNNPEAANPSRDPAPAVRVHWPEIHREEVASFNPFQVPDNLQKKSPLVSPQTTQPLQVAQSATSPPMETTEPVGALLGLKPKDEQARIRAIERNSRLERTRAIASELQKQGVGMVLSTAAGAVARIGEQEVRVGDVINGVLRITEINADGLVVEEVNTPQEVVAEPEPFQTAPDFQK